MSLNYKFSSLGNTPQTYLFGQEEVIEEEQENYYTLNDDEIINGIENKCDFFRPESIIINDQDNSFLRQPTTKNNATFEYMKSDYYFFSYIRSKKTNEIKFSDMYFYNDKPFFRWFGFDVVPMNEVEKAISYLRLISININQNNFDEEKAKAEWKKYKLTKNEELINYESTKLEDLNEELINSVEQWVLAFHNYGMENQILFTFVDLKSEESTIYFEVGKNYSRNRCFVTFMYKDRNRNSIQPCILSLIAKTIKENINDDSNERTYTFHSITDQYFLIQNISDNEEVPEHFEEYITLNYKINVSEDSKKIQFSYPTGQTQRIQIKSVSKFLCFFEFERNYILDDSAREYLNKFNKHITYQEVTNDETKTITYQEVTNDGPDIAEFSYDTDVPVASLYNDNKLKEYKVFVGLRNVKYPGKIASHFSLFSLIDLKAIYVDLNMEKVYAAFYGKNYVQIVEGEIGTQKIDDMILTLDLDAKPKDKKPKFIVDKSNQLYFKFDEKLYKYVKGEYKWEETNDGFDEIEQKESKQKSPFNECCSSEPTGIEINNKLFLLSSTDRLYHPPWRNCTLRHGIMSTFYRFASHPLPDQIVFENFDRNKSQSQSQDIVSAVIYTQIDIGFRGNTQSIFDSSNMSGVFEYCDRAFSFPPLKYLSPYTKTDCIFFNNGNQRHNLQSHRIKCQIAATSLFAYACSIYGPGMRIRDFLFSNEKPYLKEKFSMNRKFLIATYGTLLKMQNEMEFNFAFDLICEDLQIKDGRKVYENLMNELGKDYY